MRTFFILFLAFLYCFPVQAQEGTDFYPYQYYMVRDTRDRQNPVENFGYNTDVGANEETIWAVGGTYTGFIQSASAIRIKAGGNSADSTGAAGCQVVEVIGLDENWDRQTVSINTNGGTASSATSESWFRINDAHCIQAGTYHGLPTGDIDIETTGGTLMARVLAVNGETEQVVYSVPRGYQLVITAVSVRVNASNTATIEFHRVDDANDVTTPFSGKRDWFRVPLFTGTHQQSFEGILVFDEYTDVWASATRTSGSAANVAADISGFLVKK